MKVTTMRAIDRFAGVPLCWLTGIWSLLRRRGGLSGIVRIRTALVIKFFGLGSVLLSTPVISLLLKRIPPVRIIYLTFDSNRQLLEKTGLPIEIITISNRSPASFAATAISALFRLRSASIDAAIDLEFFSKFSTLVAVLCGARFRIGFDLPALWRRFNLTHPTSLEPPAHITRLFLRTLETIGLRASREPEVAGLRSSPAEQAAMEEKLGLAGVESEVICININAGGASLERRWRPHRFVEVARQLARDNPARKIYFTGTEDERAYVDAALQAGGDAPGPLTNCCGMLSLGELVALFERARFLVTNDSGPMHVAAAAGVPVVALFGPESPEYYSPRGRAKICYKSVVCSPCLNIYNAKQFVCPHRTRCMEEISTGDVLEAIESLMSEIRVDIS